MLSEQSILTKYKNAESYFIYRKVVLESIVYVHFSEAEGYLVLELRQRLLFLPEKSVTGGTAASSSSVGAAVSLEKGRASCYWCSPLVLLSLVGVGAVWHAREEKRKKRARGRQGGGTTVRRRKRGGCGQREGRKGGGETGKGKVLPSSVAFCWGFAS
uniref:Uncharacterized protein n=1 Tax=Solanum lycopersicum TaxID=4081 RepID=K4AUJ4_SOLLC